jgi:hypothetical protein
MLGFVPVRQLRPGLTSARSIPHTSGHALIQPADPAALIQHAGGSESLLLEAWHQHFREAQLLASAGHGQSDRRVRMSRLRQQMLAIQQQLPTTTQLTLEEATMQARAFHDAQRPMHTCRLFACCCATSSQGLTLLLQARRQLSRQQQERLQMACLTGPKLVVDCAFADHCRPGVETRSVAKQV